MNAFSEDTKALIDMYNHQIKDINDRLSESERNDMELKLAQERFNTTLEHINNIMTEFSNTIKDVGSTLNDINTSQKIMQLNLENMGNNLDKIDERVSDIEHNSRSTDKRSNDDKASITDTFSTKIILAGLAIVTGLTTTLTKVIDYFISL